MISRNFFIDRVLTWPNVLSKHCSLVIKTNQTKTRPMRRRYKYDNRISSYSEKVPQGIGRYNAFGEWRWGKYIWLQLLIYEKSDSELPKLIATNKIIGAPGYVCLDLRNDESDLDETGWNWGGEGFYRVFSLSKSQIHQGVYCLSKQLHIFTFWEKWHLVILVIYLFCSIGWMNNSVILSLTAQWKGIMLCMKMNYVMYNCRNSAKKY